MMRRVPVIAAAALLLAAGAAYATTVTVEIDKEVVVASATSTPKALPARGGAPIEVNTSVRVFNRDGSQPPALKTLTFLFDGNGSIDSRGVPVCTDAKLADTTTAEARKRCAGALVGKGTGKVRVTMPGKAPVEVTYPLSLFNGPPAHGMPTLIGHFRETVPAAKTVLVPIAIERIHLGRYAYRVQIEVPPIAEGFGSPTLTNATLGRTFVRAGRKLGFVNAHCKGGRLQLQGVLRLANGDRFPATLTSACHVRG
jgi:hypothetical protein